MNFSRHRAHLAGELAVRRGLITQEDLERCLELAEEGKSLECQLGERLGPGAVAGLLHDLKTDDLKTLIDSTVPAEVRDADPSRRFGKYILGSEIGRGGMGVVYRAWQEDLGRWVALKILRSEAGTARFLQEAQLAARVTHPNLVPIYEVSQEKTIPYIAMALLEGGSLDRRTLAPREALEIMSTVALAVDEIHRHGIVHRDIKPGNLLLDARGRVYLGDFGLARPVVDVAQLSASGAFVGTLGFAPPEQVSSKRETIGPRSDVYALGATLYALLCGRPPFDGEDIFSTAQKVLTDEAPPLRRFNPNLHRDLDTICRRAMSKRPEDRYASAVEFGRDLKRFLGGEIIIARPSSILERSARGFRRHRAVVIAVVAIAIAIGITLIARPGPDTSREEALRSLDQAREMLKGANPRVAEAHALLKRVTEDPALAGHAWFLLGDHAKAEQHFRNSRDPSIVAARGRLRIEQALWKLGSGEDAREFLDPGDAGPLVAVLRKLVDRKLDEAVAACDEEIRKGSPENACEIARGMARLMQGRPEEAVADFTSAIRHSPANALAFYGRAAAYERSGRRVEAIEDYTRTHELRPSFARALTHRALNQQILGKDDAALESYDLAIRSAPGDLALQAERIGVLHRTGREALPEAEAFVARNPGFSPGYTARGEILRARKRPHEALQDFDKAVELDPASPFGWAARGDLYMELLDFERAETDLSKAISIGAHRAFLIPWHSQRGRARAGLNRNEESHEDFEFAVRYDPTNGDYVFNRGYLRLLLKRYDEGRADLKESVRLKWSLLPKVQVILEQFEGK